MAFNGSGVFVRVYSWQTDKINGIQIRADRMDGEDDGFATGLSTAICKDGQQTVTANIPFAGFRLTTIGAATAATDALRADQVQSNSLTYYTTGGVADALTLTPVPSVAAYTAGQSWQIKISAANLTTTPTLAVSGLSAITIVNADGTALGIGNLALGGVYEVTYESSAGKFFLINKSAAGAFGLQVGAAKTTDFTAVVNTRYNLTKSAAVTITMPAAPSVGDVVQIEIGGVAGLVTYGLNSLKYYGSTSNPTSSAQGVQTFVYHSATTGWIDS